MAALIRLQAEHWQQMRLEVARNASEEACGLVAGKEGSSEKVYAIENALHSPVRFRMEPEAQVRALLEIDSLGLDLLAIYHSHPTGPATLSPTDIAEAAYPEVTYLIWYADQGEWKCKAYLIEEDQVRPVDLVIDQ